MGSFDSLETAARVRDIIERKARQTVQTFVDSPLVGRVIDVDLSKLTCMVWFTGDTQPVMVNLFSNIIPGAWARRNALPSDISTNTAGYGSMVVVQRLNGKLYVVNVMNGGQFGYDAELTGMKLTQQIPYALNENVAGLTYEMFAGLSMDVTTAESPLNRGEALVFGPFMPDNLTDVTSGDIEMTVRVEGYGVQAFKFNLNATDQFVNGSFTTNRWYRVLPNSTQTDNAAGLHYDFDLDIAVKRTAYGANKTFTPRELWMRIVKQTNDFSSMKTNMTFRSGIAQRALSVDNRFIREIDRSPRHIVGYLGFHKASAAMPDYETSTGFDSFGRSFISVMESGNRPYAITTSAPFAVSNNKLTFSLAGTYAHYIVTDMVSANNDWEGTVDFTMSALPSTGTTSTGIILRYVDHNNYHSAGMLISTSGQIQVFTRKRVASTFTTTNSIPTFGTFSITDTYRIRSRIEAGVVSVKFWRPFIEDEPVAWMQSLDMTSGLTTGDVGGIEVFSTSAAATPFTFDNLQLGYLAKPPVAAETTPWRSGPWRSSVLRAGYDLQRTMSMDGVFQWDGTNIKWTNNIYLSGIGKHRNILTTGQTFITAPPTGQVIPVMPGGTTTVVSGGIPLAAGQSLYCGVAPGSRYEDLKYNLFIVDTNTYYDDLNYQLPEWAVLICHRVPGANSVIKTGDGQYIGPVPWAFGEAGIHGDYPNSLTTISLTYADLGGGTAFSFTKKYTHTRIRFDLHSTFYAQISSTGVAFGMNINSVDYDVARLKEVVPVSQHTQVSGFMYVAAGVVPANTYTVTPRWKATNNTNTITRDTFDTYSISARELL